MSEGNNSTYQFSDELKAEIDKWIAQYPEEHKQSALLPVLTAVQKAEGGRLLEAHIDAVANYLSLSKIAVYEVATFYALYDLKPVGKHKINVCTNVSCQLCGSEEIVSQLEERLNVKLGQTTEDGQFTLRGVECLAACVNAPMMMVDDEYYEHLTSEKVDQIIDKYQQ